MVTDEELIAAGEKGYVLVKTSMGKYIVVLDRIVSPNLSCSTFPANEDEVAVFKMLYPEVINILDFQEIDCAITVASFATYCAKTGVWR